MIVEREFETVRIGSANGQPVFQVFQRDPRGFLKAAGGIGPNDPTTLEEAQARARIANVTEIRNHGR